MEPQEAGLGQRLTVLNTRVLGVQGPVQLLAAATDQRSLPQGALLRVAPVGGLAALLPAQVYLTVAVEGAAVASEGGTSWPGALAAENLWAAAVENCDRAAAWMKCLMPCHSDA